MRMESTGSHSHTNVMENFEERDIIPKDDEIEEARWFSIPEAIDKAVSIFDIEALKRLI